MVKRGLFCLLMVLLFPFSVTAIPTITCHCFQDMSYNPDQPAAADEYYLASVQNSFFAAVFNTDRKSVVKQKKNGVSSDDLWIASWIGKIADIPAQRLLAQKRAQGEWSAILSSLSPTIETQRNSLAQALKACVSKEFMAQAVVEDVFVHYSILDQRALRDLRNAGASNQELVIATLLSKKTGEIPQRIYLNVKNGMKTWGEYISMTQLSMDALRDEFFSMLNGAQS